MAPRGPAGSKKENYRLTLLRKMDKHFRGKVWDIIEEFHLPEGTVAYTTFGRPARHVWIIQDRESGQKMVVGYKILKYIHELYQGANKVQRSDHWQEAQARKK